MEVVLMTGEVINTRGNSRAREESSLTLHSAVLLMRYFSQAKARLAGM